MLLLLLRQQSPSLGLHFRLAWPQTWCQRRPGFCRLCARPLPLNRLLMAAPWWLDVGCGECEVTLSAALTVTVIIFSAIVALPALPQRHDKGRPNLLFLLLRPLLCKHQLLLLLLDVVVVMLLLVVGLLVGLLLRAMPAPGHLVP